MCKTKKVKEGIEAVTDANKDLKKNFNTKNILDLLA